MGLARSGWSDREGPKTGGGYVAGSIETGSYSVGLPDGAGCMLPWPRRQLLHFSPVSNDKPFHGLSHHVLRLQPTSTAVFRPRLTQQEEVFNRMKPHEQQAFISENPTHFLNPHRADYIRAQRGVYRGTDMFGQPRPWWSRWGQGTGIGTMGGVGGMGGTGGQMYGSGMGHMGQYGQMGHMGPMGPYTGMAGMPGGGGQVGPQSAYTAAPNQRSQGERGGGGWKKWFSKGGGGVGAQQAYLAQQQQLLHQHQRAMSHGQPVAVAGGGDGGPEYDQSKEAGYGYGEFGQPQYPHQPHTQGQDVRQVYAVPEYSYAGNAGQMGQVRQMGPGQGGQGQPVMVYPTAQRWQ